MVDLFIFYIPKYYGKLNLLYETIIKLKTILITV